MDFPIAELMDARACYEKLVHKKTRCQFTRKPGVKKTRCQFTKKAQENPVSGKPGVDSVFRGSQRSDLVSGHSKDGNYRGQGCPTSVFPDALGRAAADDVAEWSWRACRGISWPRSWTTDDSRSTQLRDADQSERSGKSETKSTNRPYAVCPAREGDSRDRPGLPRGGRESMRRGWPQPL